MTGLNRRQFAALGGALALGGCALVRKTPTTTAPAKPPAAPAATIPADAATAATVWGIVKGIDEVALQAVDVLDPAAGAIITAGIAIADPLVEALAAGKPDPATAASSISTILTQSQAVLVAAAPAITAVANKA